MPPQLFAHPFSSYSQKALIALYENDVAFELRMLDQPYPETYAEFVGLWPLKRFPLLVEDDQVVPEATSIIEYLQWRHPGPVALIPHDPAQALHARTLDRFFDNYVATPQQKIVFDSMRAQDARDAQGVEEAKQMLDTAYAWLETTLADRRWAIGEEFTLADCAAAPSLFYADWTHPIPTAHARVHAYRQRLLARPSFARAVDEARPYRKLFPLGAPDRD